MSTSPFRLGIVGARGHTGQELIRLVARHPAFYSLREWNPALVRTLLPESLRPDRGTQGSIYAYRAGFLRAFTGLPQGRLEQLESLEQLRVLEAGYRIAVSLTPEPFPPGVDTPEDLARAELQLVRGQ